MKTYLYFLIALIFCFSLPVLATAETPDGFTPAEEDVCAILLDGVNDNLYGLCNAFCEARDCDSQIKQDKACDQLKSNFMQRASKGTMMPCLRKDECIDKTGHSSFFKVKDCRYVKSDGTYTLEEQCNLSFQPWKYCEKESGNDTVSCVWVTDEFGKGRCTVPSQKWENWQGYCCVDSVEKNVGDVFLRINDDAYSILEQ